MFGKFDGVKNKSTLAGCVLNLSFSVYFSGHYNWLQLDKKVLEHDLPRKQGTNLVLFFLVRYVLCGLWWLENIRIFHGCEVRIEKSIRGSLFGITRLCRVMPNSDPEGRIFISALNSHGRLFFLHIFWSLAFDFNVGVPINESLSYMLTSAILKFEVICQTS